MIEPGWTSHGYNWESAYIYLRSRLGTNYLINMYVDIDSKNTSRRIIYVSGLSIFCLCLSFIKSIDCASSILISLIDRVWVSVEVN